MQTRLGSDVAVAVAVAGLCSCLRPLAWELPYAMDTALKNTPKKGKHKSKQSPTL